MINNIGLTKAILPNKDTETSIALLEEEIANRSFSLLNNKLYSSKSNISTTEMLDEIINYKKLKREKNKLCFNKHIYIAPPFVHQENCNI